MRDDRDLVIFGVAACALFILGYWFPPGALFGAFMVALCVSNARRRLAACRQIIEECGKVPP